MKPNARPELLPEAGAQRTLAAVACTLLLGSERPLGHRWMLPLHRPYPLVGSHAQFPMPCPYPRLLEHLVRLEKDGRGNREAEGLGGLEVNDQLEFRGLLHRQVSGFGAFQD